MYTPKHFSLDEWRQISEIIRQNSFATVLSFPENENPYINHIPIIFETESGPQSTLIGHMAKRNPQWIHFKNNPDCTLIFHGPHAYITPLWYKSGRDVPTWNYAAVHFLGKIEILDGFRDQIEILKKLTRFFEGEKPGAWEFELPDDLMDEAALTSAIVSFRFRIEKIEAKIKLSQNRNEADRQGVIDGLEQRPDEMSQAIRQMMLKT
jgi:transcriptional regulator